MVKALVDRVHKISNTWTGLHHAMEKTKLALQKNLLPPELIENVVKNYPRDQCNSAECPNEKEDCYFKFPCVGFVSRHPQNKIKAIIRKLCNDEVNINIVFVLYKIGCMFSAKDKIPYFVKSLVAYKIVNLVLQL